MVRANRRMVVRSGVAAGAFAGAMLASVEAVLATFGDVQVGAALRLFTPLGAGPDAGGGGSWWTWVGLALHLGISMGYGALFGWFMDGREPRFRDSYVRSMAAGGLFSVLLWAVNVQGLARLLPGDYGATGLGGATQLFAHLLAFGLPLGFYFTLKLRDLEVAGVHRARHRLQNPTGQDETERFRRELRDRRREDAEPPSSRSRHEHDRSGEEPRP